MYLQRGTLDVHVTNCKLSHVTSRGGKMGGLSQSGHLLNMGQNGPGQVGLTIDLQRANTS